MFLIAGITLMSIACVIAGLKAAVLFMAGFILALEYLTGRWK